MLIVIKLFEIYIFLNKYHINVTFSLQIIGMITVKLFQYFQVDSEFMIDHLLTICAYIIK